MAKPKNWIKIKAEYLADPGVSIKDLATKFKTSFDYLRNLAVKEKWKDEKDRIQKNAEKDAIEEVESSVKDLIVRHAKVARFLQAASIGPMRTVIEHLKKNPKVLQSTNLVAVSKILQSLTIMASKGLESERDLYPKQMKIEGDLELSFAEVSDELKKAAHDALVKQVTTRPAGGNSKDSGKRQA
jgi:hypothetical protein